MNQKCVLLCGTLAVLTILSENLSHAIPVPFFRNDYIFDSETQNFYKIHTIKRNWANAQKRCQLEGADLFVPDSQLDRDVARDIVDGKFPKHPELPIYPWLHIGIHDMFSEGEFVTIEGKSIDSVFIEWDVSEPNNVNNEDCVAMRRNGRMNDLKCELELPFICKKTRSTIKWNYLCDLPDQNYIYEKSQGKCYKLHKMATSWNEAYAICSAELSYLAIINSQSEREHLVSLVKDFPRLSEYPEGFQYEVHLGFQKLFQNKWSTVFGQPLSEAGFFKWANGQPDNWKGDERCGAMFTSGLLNDESCANSSCIFICEHDIGSLSSMFDERVENPVTVTDIASKATSEKPRTSPAIINPSTETDTSGKLETPLVVTSPTVIANPLSIPGSSADNLPISKPENVGTEPSNQSTWTAHAPFFRKDYEFNADTQNFYKLHNAPRTWTEAKARCVLEGASLYAPDSKQDWEAVLNLMERRLRYYSWAWIGIHDFLSEGEFITVDGVPIDDVYHEWGDGEPNDQDGAEDCVMIRKTDKKINDGNCQHKYPFICKKTRASINWNVLCNLPDNRYLYNRDLGKCYKLHLKPTNWTEAYSICAAEQSYLAVINSKAESDHFVKMVKNAPKDTIKGYYLSGAVLIGFHNLFDEGFSTVQGVKLEDSGFAVWGGGQPDRNGDERCGSMFYDGTLNDMYCGSICIFMCEHDISDLSSNLDKRISENEVTS